MTSEEIIERLRTMKAALIFAADATPEAQEMAAWASEAINGAISDLEGPTREQVEKVWRGEWIAYLDGEHIMPERYYSCSKCGGRGHLSKRNFCDFCGAPMTDKAVDMVMERLEALGYGKDD